LSRTCGWTRGRPRPFRGPGPAADLELGDHEPARIRAQEHARRSAACPIFIPWWTSSTSRTTLARWASSTCTSWPGSSAATRRRRDLTPAWNGGIYWAGQRLSPRPPSKAPPIRWRCFIFRRGRTHASAQAFAQLYAHQLGRKYSGLKPDLAAQKAGCGEPARRRGRAGLFNQRRPGCHHHARQAGLCRRELSPGHGAQADRPDSGCAGIWGVAHGERRATPKNARGARLGIETSATHHSGFHAIVFAMRGHERGGRGYD
jgi:hypothetical protein